MTAFPAAPVILQVLFAVCVATTVAGALIAVLTSRIIRSVCGLALCCIGLAGLYYFLHSPFLALMEILIYVGAICVTIVFAVMLAEPEEPAPESRGRLSLFSSAVALGISALVFGAVCWLGAQADWSLLADRVNDGSVRAIGVALLTTYSLAFEMISLVLLVAILGALVVARTGRTKA